MNRRFLYADRLFPVYRPSIQEGILVMDASGRIIEVVDPIEDTIKYDTLLRHPDLERFHGALVPGFINAHCHLELSHLKGRIPEGTGLPGFLRSVTGIRDVPEDIVLEAMIKADRSMHEEGIVGVGDISNREDSLQVKKSSSIRYHTFVEVFDLDPSQAELRFESGSRLVQRFRESRMEASLSPHATYTVSHKLFSLIAAEAQVHDMPVTVHNQETISEDDFFLTGTGALGDFLRGTGKYDSWIPSGRTALRTTMAHLMGYPRTMLVHNTFTSDTDLAWALEKYPTLFWCLCPKANRYIESRLPSAGQFVGTGARLAIGTDSLASNDRLSLLDEVEELLMADASLSFEQLLPAMTIHPASFLGWENEVGDFKSGKAPGIVHLKFSDNRKCGFSLGRMIVNTMR
ncbi:MAG: amidohydrolase family protein [Bacteroidota bacterium]